MESIQNEITRKLRSEEIEVRLSALNALAVLPEGAIEHAVEALSDGEWRVRKAAVAILSEQADRSRIIQQLIDRLGREKNIGMRNAAVEVFIQIGAAAVAPLLVSLGRTDDDIRKLIVDTLGEIGDRRAAPTLMALLSDQNENVAASAVEALGKLKDPAAVEPLIRTLKKDNPLLVFSAMRALQQMGDARAIEPLIEVSQKNIYRRGGLEVLGAIGDLRALGTFLSALRSGPKGTRHAALKALGALESRQSEANRILIQDAVREIYDEGFYALLMETLHDSDLALQKVGIRVLGWVQEARSVSALFPFILSEVREEVVESLVAIGKKAVDPLLSLSAAEEEGIREVMAAVLGRVGTRKAVPLLSAFLRDGSGHVRQASAGALGKIKDPSAITALLPLLGDPYPNVQEAAVKALMEMKRDLPRRTILNFLRHDSYSFRSNALLILGQIGATEMLPLLGLLLRDSEKGVRKIAVEVLGSFNMPEMAEHLLLSLGDESSDVRLAALKILAQKEVRHIPDLVDYLHPLLHDESIWVRSAIPPILSRLEGEKGEELLSALLNDPIGVVKIAALSVLGARGGKRLLPSVLAETENPDLDIRKSAILALGRLGEASVVPRLERFLSDPNWTIRLAAVHAVGHFKEAASIHSLKELSESDADFMVREAAQAVLSQLTAGGGPAPVGRG